MFPSRSQPERPSSTDLVNILQDIARQRDGENRLVEDHPFCQQHYGSDMRQRGMAHSVSCINVGQLILLPVFVINSGLD